MKEILKLNPISGKVNDILGENYTVTDNAEKPEGILVRSFDMHEYDMPSSVLCVARAGAGVNNIPSEAYAEKGIVVFNTPGANANAVNELVITSLLLGSRKIVPAIDWVKGIKDEADISKLVEKGKKQFVGREISGKKLGVIGLGAIGAKVANSAVALGMQVLGYDPYLSVVNALHLSHHINITNTLDDMYKTCDYITIHVPYLKDNHHMINADKIALMKKGVVIINCARGELVDNQAILNGVASGKIARYITDFPAKEIIGVDNIICIPHLGASTPEAEDNCAVMAAKQLKEYIENGNIVNSVNYPNCSAPKTFPCRLAILHLNQHNMIAQFTTILGDRHINIDNLVNASKGNYAYTIIDIEEIDDDAFKAMSAIEGIIKIRKI